MNNSNYIIIFFSILIIVFGIYFYKVEGTKISGIEINETKNILTNATYDSISTIASSNNNTNIFENENDRLTAESVFFQTLCNGFGYDGTTFEDEFKLYVPLLLFIDSNGLYVITNEEVNENIVSVRTPLIPYSETIDGNMLKYDLMTEEVTLLKKGETNTVTGHRKDIYSLLNSSVIFDFLNDEAEFLSHKTAIITNNITKETEYYVNKNNKFANNIGINYSLNIPELKTSDLSRMILRPSVLAFYQGKQMGNKGIDINIYSFSGGDMKKLDDIKITNIDEYGLVYHRSDCFHANNAKMNISTIKEAVKLGANPCPFCY